MMGGNKHTFQLSIDILNIANLLNSDWGVRKVASAAATSPLEFVTDPNTDAPIFTAEGEPQFYFKGTATETYINDPGILSRWRAQIGLRYFFN